MDFKGFDTLYSLCQEGFARSPKSPFYTMVNHAVSEHACSVAFISPNKFGSLTYIKDGGGGGGGGGGELQLPGSNTEVHLWR